MSEKPKVTDYLRKGRDQARTRFFLASQLGISDRQLRRAISREISAGTPIVSSSDACGYWLPEDGLEGIGDLEQALMEIYSRQAALSKKANTYYREIQRRKWGMDRALREELNRVGRE